MKSAPVTITEPATVGATISAPSAPVVISGPNATATLIAGETLYDTGGDDTLVLPASGSVTISGNTVNNGDLFDLRAALATTTWNGDISQLGSYLSASTTNGGQDLQVLIHPTGGTSSSILATLAAAGTMAGAYTRFLQHAVLTTAGSAAPVFISGPGVTVTTTSGETLYDTGGGNTLVLPAAGSVTFSGNTLYNGDEFDVRAAMAQTTWNGSSASIGNYLTTTTTNGGQDLQLMIHPTGGTSSSLLATFTSVGQNINTLPIFEKQAIF